MNQFRDFSFNDFKQFKMGSELNTIKPNPVPTQQNKKRYEFHVAFQATSDTGKVFVFENYVSSSEKHWSKEGILELKKIFKDNLKGPVNKITILCITPLRKPKNSKIELEVSGF